MLLYKDSLSLFLSVYANWHKNYSFLLVNHNLCMKMSEAFFSSIICICNSPPPPPPPPSQLILSSYIGINILVFWSAHATRATKSDQHTNYICNITESDTSDLNINQRERERKRELTDLEQFSGHERHNDVQTIQHTVAASRCPPFCEPSSAAAIENCWSSPSDVLRSASPLLLGNNRKLLVNCPSDVFHRHSTETGTTSIMHYVQHLLVLCTCEYANYARTGQPSLHTPRLPLHTH